MSCGFPTLHAYLDPVPWLPGSSCWLRCHVCRSWPSVDEWGDLIKFKGIFHQDDLKLEIHHSNWLTLLADPAG